MSKSDNLTPRQSKAIASLLVNGTNSAAAKAANVSERTICRWRKKDAFKTELKRVQEKAYEKAAGRTYGETPLAFETLASIHRDPEVSPAVRVQAAQAILNRADKIREQRDLTERVEKLEEKIL